MGGGRKMGSASAVRDSLGRLSRTAECFSGAIGRGGKTHRLAPSPVRYDDGGLQSRSVTMSDADVRSE
ncbi:hypothetical protein GCM10010222_53660 [Streptomyces tanashiensis]|nr:hypothetical protein GCM10010222_53660 [Streptomyces tanashiensis]